MQVRTDGRRAFMFTLGAVFAKDAIEAERYATEHGLRGIDARSQHAELAADEVDARRRSAGVHRPGA